MKECRYPAGEEMKRPGEVFSVMSLGAFSSSQRRIKNAPIYGESISKIFLIKVVVI